jgi:hypothetical protein
MTASTDVELRELDHRTTDGFDVRLLWDPASGRVSIALREEDSGGSVAFDVDPADALDAFQHPFVYAPIQRSGSRAIA